MAKSALGKLTSGRLLARNTLFNLFGYGAPLLIAVFAVPMLIGGLGTARFGVLMLAWAVIGYFSLFDLGMGRALTKLVAEKLGTGREQQDIPALVWTGLSIMISIGLAGTLVILLLSPWMVRGVLEIPQDLQSETLYAFYLLAFSVPMVIGAAGLRGVLEAQQRFDLVNAVRIPMSAFNYLGPLLVLPFSRNLAWVVAVLLGGRLVSVLVHLILCFYTMPQLRRGVVLRRAVVRPMFSLGGWMTVAHGVGSFLVSIDRFLIGALVSATAVAYYATPAEVVGALWIIPEALVGVLFAAFSASFLRDRDRTTRLFGQGVKCIFLSVFPITLVIATLAHEGLGLWLGPEFAQESAPVLQWLAFGILVNTLTFVPYALIQSAGRPDLTAIVHVVEFCFYLLIAWWLIGSYGLMGAVAAYVIRVMLDAGVMFAMVRWFLPIGTPTVWRAVLTLTGALATMIVAMSLTGIVVKGLFLVLALSVFAFATWFLILAPEERVLVQTTMKVVRNRTRSQA